MQPTKPLKRQTDKEFQDYFKDCLNSKLRNAFSSNKKLVFVTYQPSCVLAPNELKQQTKDILKSTYVEVLEKNYKTNTVYNSADYIGGYHSHIITSDNVNYLKSKKITYTNNKDGCCNGEKHRYKGYDIVIKTIYDLDRLVIYLAK